MTQQIGRTVMAMAIVATLGPSVAHAQEQRKTNAPTCKFRPQRQSGYAKWPWDDHRSAGREPSSRSRNGADSVEPAVEDR
jgi:hypothetical protein